MINNGTNSQVTGTQPIKLQEIFRYSMWNNFDYNHQNFYFNRKKFGLNHSAETQLQNRLKQTLFLFSSTVQSKQRLYFTSNLKELAFSQTHYPLAYHWISYHR